MKTFWVIYDDFGCFNFFSSKRDFDHARNHVHGLMECDSTACDSFQAENVYDVWTTEELLRWRDGMEV